jgi:hypothetical protein
MASGSQPVDQGYDVNVNTIHGDRRAAALGHTNATLADGDFQYNIFVSGMNLDSAQSGSTAQSQLTRDWYAHNFVQPSFTVIGWSLDQKDYGTMVEFVHAAQFKAINSNANLTQLAIAGRTGGKSGTGLPGDQGQDGGRTGGPHIPAVTISNPGRLMKDAIQSDPPGSPRGTYYNQTIRGSHKPTVAKGYIATMPRIHQRFKGAVQWEFQFVVAVMIQGLYDEQAVVGANNTTPMWQAMLNAAQKDGVFVVTKSVLKENKASLAYAASHKDSLPGAETGGSSSGGSTPTGGTGTGAQWRVVASAEDDPPGALASCGPLPADRRGHSVLSVSGLSSDAGTAGQALSPGKLWPCSAKLIVTNPANNRSVTISHVDNGAGSSFRPIIGLYPQTRADLGLDNSGQYSVIIQAATGAPEPHPVRGTRI